MTTSIAQPFQDFQISTVSDAPFFIDALFLDKFNSAAPEYGHGVVAFWRRDRHCFVPMCFANFTPQGDILLGGGAVSDTSALRQLPAEIRRAIKAAGGLYFNLLKFVQHRFADEYDAIFGYCADPRAMMVDLAAGFERTEHKNLIVYFPRRLSARRQRKLIEQAHKVGPF